jgi:hypothetical protein
MYRTSTGKNYKAIFLEQKFIRYVRIFLDALTIVYILQVHSILFFFRFSAFHLIHCLYFCTIHNISICNCLLSSKYHRSGKEASIDTLDSTLHSVWVSSGGSDFVHSSASRLDDFFIYCNLLPCILYRLILPGWLSFLLH